jgi:restriction system protein
MTDRTHRVRTPIFPVYSDVLALLRIWESEPKGRVLKLIQDIWDQTGTPQNPVDWTDPDAWIEERLKGESADLARRIWVESGRQVNPRHTYGVYLYINTYQLLQPDDAGVYQLTPSGTAFLAGDPVLLRELDEVEGIGKLLAILSTKARARRSDLLPDWGEYLREHSKFGTSSTIKDTLRRRLVNLVQRGYVERDGNYYLISPDGLEYAASFVPETAADPRREVVRAISAFNDARRQALRDALSVINPTAFEHLVRDLLEAMGYEDVQVTKQSGDKGVDVVATVQFGITSIIEVVQVKRHKSSITRPVLDQLRGALPYHKAIRGTIITLGSFTAGCKEAAVYPGAAPITLIDGARLLTLLEEHEVGLQKKAATLLELDEAYVGGTEDVVAQADVPEALTPP